MSGDLGRGSVSVHGVLKLEDGMNVADLRKQLDSLPASGVLYLGDIQTLSEKQVRIAVEIKGGTLAGKEL
jgi:hypothetical protein